MQSRFRNRKSTFPKLQRRSTKQPSSGSGGTLPRPKHRESLHNGAKITCPTGSYQRRETPRAQSSPIKVPNTWGAPAQPLSLLCTAGLTFRPAGEESNVQLRSFHYLKCLSKTGIPDDSQWEREKKRGRAVLIFSMFRCL